MLVYKSVILDGNSGTDGEQLREFNVSLSSNFRDMLSYHFHLNYWELFWHKVFTNRKKRRYKEKIFLLLKALESREYKSRMWTKKVPNLRWFSI